MRAESPLFTSDMKVISVIQIAFNRPLSKAFQSATFHSAVEEAVHKCVSEPQSADTFATRRIDAFSFTLLVDTSLRLKVEKNAL